jgi:hypothetical protein
MDHFAGLDVSGEVRRPLYAHICLTFGDRANVQVSTGSPAPMSKNLRRVLLRDLWFSRSRRAEKRTCLVSGAKGGLFPQSRNFFVVRFAMRGEHQVVGPNIGQAERSRPVLELHQTQLTQQNTAT